MNVIEFPITKEEIPVLEVFEPSTMEEAEELAEIGLVALHPGLLDEEDKNKFHTSIRIRHHLDSFSTDDLFLEMEEEDGLYKVSLIFKEQLGEKELLFRHGVNFKGVHWTYPDVQPALYKGCVCIGKFGRVFIYTCKDKEYKE